MAIAPALTIAAAGFGVASALSAGSAASDAANFQSDQAAAAAEVGKTQGAQVSAYYDDQLRRTLANITAVRAGAGLDPNSPTGQTIAADQTKISDTEKDTKLGNINAQIASDTASAAFYQDSASNALLGGYLGAGGSLLTGAAGAFKSSSLSK